MASSLHLKAWGCPPHSLEEQASDPSERPWPSFQPDAARVDEFVACDHAGAVMVYDEPTCDPSMECWWPPQVC